MLVVLCLCHMGSGHRRRCLIFESRACTISPISPLSTLSRPRRSTPPLRRSPGRRGDLAAPPSLSLCVSPLSLSIGLSLPLHLDVDRAATTGAAAAATLLVLLLRPPSPASHLRFSLPFIPLSPLPSRGGGGCQATTPLRVPCRHGRGSVASSLSPILRAGSSTPPPAGELVLLCSKKP